MKKFQKKIIGMACAVTILSTMAVSTSAAGFQIINTGRSACTNGTISIGNSGWGNFAISIFGGGKNCKNNSTCNNGSSCGQSNCPSSPNCDINNRPNCNPDNNRPDGKPDQPDNTPPVVDPDYGQTKPELSAFSEEVVRLVNQERAKAGLSALTVQTQVQAAADVRAKEQTISFSHTRPDGTSFFSALTEQGVSYRGAGENIAWGQQTPEQVMNAWMNSSGHRANILNKNFTTIGVGCYQDANGTYYWTQLFTY